MYEVRSEGMRGVRAIVDDADSTHRVSAGPNAPQSTVLQRPARYVARILVGNGARRANRIFALGRSAVVQTERTVRKNISFPTSF